ncbi:tRNA-specific adenosine deaminase 1 isoform X2 [Hippocampus comes]|uniref:tRNA-specific adenosine deaminase 1 n=1 Tax=Hippocampus comes TaxID=109280 RepID=A0A3Q2Z3J4_HIPCM|nr:PREDICTED: tRNA-specific adenosine deaminase 1 isoform X2 [Hippocampus comes]
MVTADEIAKLCYERFNELPRRGKPEPGREWTSLAAVVKITRCGKSDKVTKEVVSLGTGTKCIGQTAMSPKGDVLNDSHAEVIARRGCVRYLTQELYRAVSGRGSSVFCQTMHQGKWRLQPGISFLFFTSHTPCGDASIIPTNWRQLQVCTSVTSMKTDHRTVGVGLKRKCEAHIPHQDSKRPSKEENDPEETKPDDIQESKQPLSLPLSSSASDGEPSQSPSTKTHLETHALTSAELILKNSAPSNVSPICCARLNLQVYDIHRTGAKSVPGGLADPLEPGMGYHSTGLLRLKPGRGESTLSLSCSDKMARWGVLGFQGALLFHYLQEALYFSTVVIGKCPFSHEAMQRALITRCSHISDLPAGFSVPQPVFLHSELEFPFSRHQTELQHKEGQGCITPCGAAVSWCKVPEQQLDVTASGFKQGVTKKALGTVKARSALCKLELFHSFLSLVSSTDVSALPHSLRRTDLHTYLDYKEASEAYQQAWQLLRNQAFPLWPRSDRDLLLFR